MRRADPLRILFLGYGAVASIHAQKLSALAGTRLVAVCGPDAERAAVFAARHQIPQSTEKFSQVAEEADAAVICSPSPLHFEQVLTCLEHGLDVLVELPPCADSGQAEQLLRAAERRGLVLVCAHTSRYLEPYRLIGDQVRAGVLGEPLSISYVRHMAPRRRSWTDDALLHHAAHPLDLLLDWFDEVAAVGCVTLPAQEAARNVGLLGRLSNGAPVTLSLSYDSERPATVLRVVGASCSLETDGFSYLRSSWPKLSYWGEPDFSYTSAIAEQDYAFIRACRGEQASTPWGETLQLLRLIDAFQRLR